MNFFQLFGHIFLLKIEVANRPRFKFNYHLSHLATLQSLQWGAFYLIIANYFATQNIGGANISK